MKNWNRLLAAVLALTLCFTVTLTAVAETTEADTTAAYTDTVLATVNGDPVGSFDVDNYAYQYSYQYYSYGYDITDATLAAAIKQSAVDTAVRSTVLLQKAKELGFDPMSDEDEAAAQETANTNYEEAIQSFIDSDGTITDTSTDEEKAAAREKAIADMTAVGYTPERYLSYARQNLIIDGVYASIVAGATVTDEEVQAAFDTQVESDKSTYESDIGNYEYMTQYVGQTSYYVPAGYRGVTHILLAVDDTLLTTYKDLQAALEEQQDDTEADTTDDTTKTGIVGADATEDPAAEATATPVTQADVDAAYDAILASVQSTIDEINGKLADGVPFADLVAEYGTDPGMTQEPNKTDGYSVSMDSIMFDPAFVKAAFSINEIGGVSDPVVGNYGVHIVCYVRDVPSGAVELTDEIKATLTETLLNNKESELFSAQLDTWTNEATVEYTAEGTTYLAAATDDTAATDDAAVSIEDGDTTAATDAPEVTDAPEATDAPAATDAQ